MKEGCVNLALHVVGSTRDQIRTKTLKIKLPRPGLLQIYLLTIQKFILDKPRVVQLYVTGFPN